MTHAAAFVATTTRGSSANAPQRAGTAQQRVAISGRCEERAIRSRASLASRIERREPRRVGARWDARSDDETQPGCCSRVF